MPAIIERIKSTVRGRSRSRGSKDEIDASNNRSSTEVPQTPTLPSHFQNFSRPSLENSAFHVTGGRGVRQSLDNDPLPQRVADTNNVPAQPRKSDVASPSSPKRDIRAGDAIPTRTSSRVTIQNRPQSQHADQMATGLNGSASTKNTNFGTDSRVAGGALAQRQSGINSMGKDHSNKGIVESVPRKDNETVLVSPRKANPASTAPLKPSQVSSPTTDREASHTLSETTPIRRLSSSDGTVRRKPVPIAQSRTSQSNGVGLEQMESERNKAAAIASGHLKLPEGFDLNNTEETHVTEYHRPAVTHETIIKQRTEIVQEAITRDIHYHHYYTYLQPIKVVEILPPKHYFLNQETGEKTEIAAPAGWTMPVTTIPVSPNYSDVSGWTRHYVVNEEHPHGLLESPPLKHEGDVSDLRSTARQQAY